MRDTVLLFVLRVAFGNVPTKVKAAGWEGCFRILKARGDVVGINEAGNWRAKRVYARLAKAAGYGRYGLFIGPNPIFWDRRVYRRYSARQVRLHDSGKGRRARLWPGFNAARYMTVVVLTHLDTGRLVTFINLHFVAPGPKVPARWRAAMRNRSIARLRKIVAHHQAAGRDVVVFGDANRHGFPIPGAVWLDSSRPDVLAIVPADDTRLGDTTVEQVPAPTDHKRVVAARAELIGAAA
ncbi:endonuclease/exonuclease/phosphatase family protein [Nocardioides sp. J54]|uniref:endonuclease/exonuclease/phosphatase family protein n=1 Tax=Nocardioides sp. J54 TaxID=935866 RepID=UPI000490268F|nr:endonuclease/exonuclease/phosphatase family protein [Nocardioides sp. J54]